METNDCKTESVTKSDLLDLASWDRPRTTEDLLSFIASREAQIFAD